MKLHFVIWHEKIERKSTSGMWIDFRLARFANNNVKWQCFKAKENFRDNKKDTISQL